MKANTRTQHRQTVRRRQGWQHSCEERAVSGRGYETLEVAGGEHPVDRRPYNVTRPTYRDVYVRQSTGLSWMDRYGSEGTGDHRRELSLGEWLATTDRGRLHRLSWTDEKMDAMDQNGLHQDNRNVTLARQRVRARRDQPTRRSNVDSKDRAGRGALYVYRRARQREIRANGRFAMQERYADPVMQLRVRYGARMARHPMDAKWVTRHRTQTNAHRNGRQFRKRVERARRQEFQGDGRKKRRTKGNVAMQMDAWKRRRVRRSQVETARNRSRVMRVTRIYRTQYVRYKEIFHRARRRWDDRRRVSTWRTERRATPEGRDVVQRVAWRRDQRHEEPYVLAQRRWRKESGDKVSLTHGDRGKRRDYDRKVTRGWATQRQFEVPMDRGYRRDSLHPDREGRRTRLNTLAKEAPFETWLSQRRPEAELKNVENSRGPSPMRTKRAWLVRATRQRVPRTRTRGQAISNVMRKGSVKTTRSKALDETRKESTNATFSKSTQKSSRTRMETRTAHRIPREPTEGAHRRKRLLHRRLTRSSEEVDRVERRWTSTAHSLHAGDRWTDRGQAAKVERYRTNKAQRRKTRSDPNRRHPKPSSMSVERWRSYPHKEQRRQWR